jgi:GT2 family glycosyltransferase
VESDAPLAPPVVAVVVVHDPGEWFEETLDSLADQDYPNLSTLFLLVDGDLDEIATAITTRLPDAFVRDLGANPGYGAAANEVLRLVEGDAGFFLFCHDDVALESDVVRLLVEELYRSNAGFVGPKLVSWDDPGVLQHVGLGLDRFGEIDPITEPGEYDQEQHDAVRDVFVLPSACILARADLFRTLGGFDSTMPFHGDDVDLCWRAHLSGARVVVAPQARVRHREELDVRRPDLHHDVLRARHRMRSVATLTGGARLPVRSLELAALTVAELVVGLFTGRLGEAWASLRSFVGLLPRTPALLARRGTIAKLRLVDDAEVVSLQSRGSARLTAYRRARDTETYVGAHETVRRWRESSIATTIGWIAVAVGIIAASRTLIDTRVPAVGELLPLPDSPRAWWADFTSAWSAGGLGNAVANPTGWAALSAGSVLWLFRMGLGLTVLVVGAVFVGVWGAWRLATLFPSNRSRMAVMVVYAAIPLTPGVISTGRFTALVGYAAIPWFVHLLRLAVGLGTADPKASDDVVDGIIGLARRERLRRTALVALVVGVAAALAPAVLPVAVLVTLVLALAGLAAGSGMRTAGWTAGLGLVACATGWLLNLPWSPTWSWAELSAPVLQGVLGRGVVDVAAMDIGQARFEIAALALYVPVLVALALARSWRLTWAARGAGLVVVFLGLAVLQDRDALPFRAPEVGLLLVPVALGVALSAGAVVAAFGQDVAGRRFGWRQPLAVLGIACVVFGVLPAALTVADGAWFLPRTGLVELVEPQLRPAAEVGDYRVLYLGDPRLIPFPSDDLGGGVAMALVDDGGADFRDRWAVADQPADDELRAVIGEIGAASTLRGGRLLAPFGVRYVVVPLIDGATSTASAPLPVPSGLLASLRGQLDLVRPPITAPGFVLFENRAAIPTTATLDGALAEASTTERLDSLVAVDTSTATATLLGADATRAADADVPAGVVHVGTPFDERWQLRVGGEDVEGRPAFTVATAYDVGAAGSASLRFVQPLGRTLWLLLVGALWAAVLLAASRVTVPARFRRQMVGDETLIDLDAPEQSSWVDELFAQEEAEGGRAG